MQKVDAGFSRDYEESLSNIRRLETAVTERKDGVLEILLKCEEDILDAKGLVISLKDAKAKVFEILNDLNIEKKNMAQNLEVEVPRYREIAGKMRNFNRILDLLMDSEHASSMLPKTGFIDLIEEIEETSHSPSVFLHKVIGQALKVVIPALSTKNRFVLQLGCNLVMNSPTKIEPFSALENLLSGMFNCQDLTPEELEKLKNEYLTTCSSPETGSVDPKEVVEVKKNIQGLIEVMSESASEGEAGSRQLSTASDPGQLFSSTLTTEQQLIQQLDEKSQRKPVLVFHDHSDVINASDVIIDIAHKEGYPCPSYVSLSKTEYSSERKFVDRINELNGVLSNCKKERRWLIVDNFHTIYRTDSKLTLPKVNPEFRIFLLTNHFEMRRFR